MLSQPKPACTAAPGAFAYARLAPDIAGVFDRADPWADPERAREVLADDLTDLKSLDQATEDRLVGLGWPRTWLSSSDARAAVAETTRRFVRRPDPVPPRDIAAEMAASMSRRTPPRQIVVAELLAEGFSKAEIDRHLPAAIDHLCRDLVEGKTGLSS